MTERRRRADSAALRRTGVVHEHVFNPSVAVLTRVGRQRVGLARAARARPHERRVADHPGEPAHLDSEQYLVAPRGETQWVRNLRVAGNGELRVGRHTDRFRATEIADADKVPILRAYLKRWKAEVGVFFDGVSGDSPDAELPRIAPDHPVFRIEIAAR